MLKINHSGFELECGTDEAGRGCLAGPVTAAAVILKPNFKNLILNDSKQVSEKKRDLLRPIIQEEALCFAFTHIYEDKIDDINIYEEYPGEISPYSFMANNISESCVTIRSNTHSGWESMPKAHTHSAQISLCTLSARCTH